MKMSFHPVIVFVVVVFGDNHHPHLVHDVQLEVSSHPLGQLDLPT